MIYMCITITIIGLTQKYMTKLVKIHMVKALGNEIRNLFFGIMIRFDFTSLYSFCPWIKFDADRLIQPLDKPFIVSLQKTTQKTGNRPVMRNKVVLLILELFWSIKWFYTFRYTTRFCIIKIFLFRNSYLFN